MNTPTIESYNKKARIQAKRFDDFGAESDLIKKTFSYIIKKRDPKVIELGCGNGRDAVEITKHTKDYEGIDASRQLVILARKKLPGIHFKVADFETYHFPKDTDAVFAFASLLHANKRAVRKILDRAHGSLTERGLFCITLQNAPYKRRVIKNAYGTRIFYFYQPESIKEMIKGEYKILQMRKAVFKGGHWLKIILQKI